MNQRSGFAEALEAAEQLDPDEQAELVAVLSRRLSERGRERVVASVAEARREFAAGQCQPMTAAEIVAYWQQEGVIGSRSEIKDSQEHARGLRQQAEDRSLD